MCNTHSHFVKFIHNYKSNMVFLYDSLVTDSIFSDILVNTLTSLTCIH